MTLNDHDDQDDRNNQDRDNQDRDNQDRDNQDDRDKQPNRDLRDSYVANHIPEDDLILFALQLLPEERMRQATSHLQTCDHCRTEIAKIQGDLAVYSMTAEPQAPPATARERFARQIAREPRLEEIRREETRREEARSAEVRASDLRAADLRASERHSTEPPPVESRRPEDRAHRAPEAPTEAHPADTLSLMPESLSLSGEPTTAARAERIPERMPERMPERAPDRMPDRISDRMPDRIAERASDEAVFTARHSRTLRTEDPREHDDDLVEDRRRPRRAPWVLAWTGWAVAIGCSFVAGVQLHQRQQMQSTMATQQATLATMQKQAVHAQETQTALSTLTAANAMQVNLHVTPGLKTTLAVKPAPAVKGAPPVIPPEALAAYLADKGALVFVATHMEPAPTGKTYELWLLPANGQNPIPAGTFKPDAQGGASIVMPHLPTGVQAKGFGVTVENDGGSQTPTLPIVMS